MAEAQAETRHNVMAPGESVPEPFGTRHLQSSAHAALVVVQQPDEAPKSSGSRAAPR